MKKTISVQDMYEKVRSELCIGVRQNRIYIKEGANWTAILTGDLAILIRSLYDPCEQKLISSGNVKEIIERLLQDPAIQLHFVEEKQEKYIKLVDAVFNVETGRIDKNITGDFGYFLNFRYIEKEARNMEIFNSFIRSVFPMETQKKRELLLEIIGYTLSDYMKAKAGFFFIGKSNSGKSTILDLIKRILPEHAVTTLPLYRLENRFNLARLADARVNICTELSEKSLAAVDIFKMLTSNETVTAEHKGCRPFEFKMRCKTLNAGNVLPAVKENDGLSAVINRMVILLFPISIAKEQQNLELPEKLYEERDGIFSEAMDALVQLRKNGFCFTESDDSIKLKNQMVEQSRILDVFLQDCCVIQKEGKIYLRTLYEAFEEYCEENLFECKYSKTQFSQFLSQKPELTRKKIRVGSGKPLSGIEGLRLKEAKEYINEESLVNRKPRNNGTKEQKMYYNRQDSEK